MASFHVLISTALPVQVHSESLSTSSVLITLSDIPLCMWCHLLLVSDPPSRTCWVTHVTTPILDVHTLLYPISFLVHCVPHGDDQTHLWFRYLVRYGIRQWICTACCICARWKTPFNLINTFVIHLHCSHLCHTPSLQSPVSTVVSGEWCCCSE